MAVLPEIAWREDEAVRVSVRMGKFYIFGVLLIMVGGWFLGGTIGFLWAALVFALVSAVPFAFTIRELFSVEQRPVLQYRQHFWRSAIGIVRQRPFWTYLIGHSLFMCGYYAVMVASPFFATQVVRLPKQATSLFYLLPMVVAITVTPAVERLSLRFGKKPVMLAAMALFSCFALLWFFVGKLTPLEGTATVGEVFRTEAAWARQVPFGALVETVALFALIGATVSVQLLVPLAIVADLVVYDERQTGQRRESLVYGLQGGIEKNAIMIATLVVSLALGLGKEAANPRGIYAVGPAAALLTLLGCLVFALYPLKKGWQEQG
jgi:Na+/melibiose symporter-like transporter